MDEYEYEWARKAGFGSARRSDFETEWLLGTGRDRWREENYG
jgi:hypothetical protein